jgi:hypothetical protein
VQILARLSRHSEKQKILPLRVVEIFYRYQNNKKNMDQKKAAMGGGIPANNLFSWHPSLSNVQTLKDA